MSRRRYRTLCVAVRDPAEESDHSSTLDRSGAVEPAEAPADLDAYGVFDRFECGLPVAFP